jgi:general secretion pathway protein A
MYETHFGLEKNPFSMTSDPNCLFMTEQHREAIAGLVYAIRSRKGLLLLTGEVGTGKTTVLSRVVRHLPRNAVQFAVILHPTLTPDEFLEMVMLNLGISGIPASKALRLHKLQKFLLSCHEENKVAALIIDEAHKLSPEVLEEIRLLGNLDAADQKLLQLVLVGQSELDEMMRRAELRQLKQRVALRVSLKALGRAEVHDYLCYRWRYAGGKSIPFSPDAVTQVIYWSSGIPRLINSLCDQSLLAAFGNGSRVVEAEYVREAARDLDLAPPVAAVKPMPIPAPAELSNAGQGGKTKTPRPHVMPAPVTMPARAAAAVGGMTATAKPLGMPLEPVASMELAPAPQPPGLAMVGGIRVPEFGGYARPKQPLLYRMAVKLGFRFR